MSIVTWEEVITRYPRLSSLTGGAEELESSYVLPAEGEVTSRLANKFTIPFSNNNVTAKDLVIDLIRIRGGSYKEKDREDMQERFDKRVERLLTGTDGMVTIVDSLFAVVFAGDGAPSIWSSTEDYPPTFGVGSVEDFLVSSEQIQDEYDAQRGN